MAGDWIKMRASLCTNPKVLLIADIISESTEVGRRMSTGFNGSLCEIVTCDVTRDITIASLLRVWCATNEHTDDGVWHNSTLRTIDQAAGIPGFGEAMAAAGWAVYDEEANTVTMPNFLENNAPAKNNARSSGAERQARYRQKLKEKAMPRDVTSDVTVTSQSDTREEKRREDTSSLRSEVEAPRKRSAKTEKPMASVNDLVAFGFTPEVAAEFIAYKAEVKAPLTQRAWQDHLAESRKASMSPVQAAEKVMAKNWKGFEAKYVASDRPTALPPRNVHKHAGAAKAIFEGVFDNA